MGSWTVGSSGARFDRGRKSLALLVLLALLAGIPEALANAAKGPQEDCEEGFREIGRRRTRALLDRARLTREMLAEWRRDYVAEVRRTKGVRIFVAPRDTGPRQPGFFGSLMKVEEFLSNPYATLMNRPRMLSRVITYPMGYLLVDKLLVEDLLFEAGDRKEEKVMAAAEQQSAKIPGGRHVWSLMELGAISRYDGAEAILKHKSTLQAWSQGERGKSFLPRAEDFRRDAGLSREQLVRLDELAREIHGQELSGERAGLALSEAIDRDPTLSRLSENVRDVLSSYFWPKARIGSRSDVRLALQVMEAPFRGPESRTPLGNIHALLRQQGLDLPSAVVMAHEVLEDPKKSARKLKEAQGLLPDEKLATANRPDLPRHSQEILFDRLGDGKPMALSAELDRWRLILSDPRLEELTAGWKSGELGDVETLQATEAWIRGMNQFQGIHRELGGRPLDELTAIRILGLSGDEDEELFNPLLAEARLLVDEVIARVELEDQQALSCYRDVAELEMKLHLEEAEWIRQGVRGPEFQKRFESAQRRHLDARQKLIDRCLEAGRVRR